MSSRVAVVIPTFNRVALLRRALESVRSAGSCVEVIVVDSGSTDETPKLCEQLPDVRYIRLGKNNGPSYARNAGIVATPCEYLTFLDDDDLLLPQSIDRRLAKLEQHPAAAFCYGEILVANQQCKPTGRRFPALYDDAGSRRPLPEGDIFSELLTENFIMMHAAVLRRSCIDAVGGFNPAVWRNEDWDLWVRITARYPVVAVTEPVGIVRMAEWTSDQLTANQKLMYRTATELQEQWLQLPRAKELPSLALRQARRQLAGNNAWNLASTAFQQCKLGHLRSAAAAAVGAMRLSPSAALGRFAQPLMTMLGYNLRRTAKPATEHF